LTQVPPITSPRSIMVTRAPASAARIAAAKAAPPLPMMAICNPPCGIAAPCVPSPASVSSP